MTKEKEDEQHKRNLADIDNVRKHYRPRIDQAERYYSQALTSLWLGNGGAALATLSFVGGLLQKGCSSNLTLLTPLWLFVLGLISMGAGSAISLVQESRELDRMQRATSLLDFKVADIKSSTEQAGLTLDFRTGMALLSALLFVSGCIAGLIALSNSN